MNVDTLPNHSGHVLCITKFRTDLFWHLYISFRWMSCWRTSFLLPMQLLLQDQSHWALPSLTLLILSKSSYRYDVWSKPSVTTFRLACVQGSPVDSENSCLCRIILFFLHWCFFFLGGAINRWVQAPIKYWLQLRLLIESKLYREIQVTLRSYFFSVQWCH